ncbi:hypothetical protein ACKUFS_13880 [Pseudomonas cannabina]|uniref:Uncharacterized protein n=1 Tax=Pseudomonas syringae pv. maculicola str. ES4326 TaxID=629265 RepID=A0A8T8BZ76_PSEYM|nr:MULTISPECIES: hypothetical protein [Pseudomonas syringae group]QHE96394.1 hypothetical protein PMA4326_007060 [Pseudomonas syringae pv. maculicola str. ES4326]QQN20547.1 hypothetical protein JGS08_18240 [Pseudomonas cannabina pv. alisalensis]UBY97053.1 hypothetical protein LCG56_24410 [Pseudomonas cannabina pv. alisalensis]
MTKEQSALQPEAVISENCVNLVKPEITTHPLTGGDVLNWKIKTIASHHWEVMRMQLLLGKV